jgi:hypothetical protein
MFFAVDVTFITTDGSDRSMTDLEPLGPAMIGFAVAIIVGGVLIGLIGAAIKRVRI